MAVWTPAPDLSLFRDDIHPRLFFGPGDVPRIRERAANGLGRRIADEIRRRCERYRDPVSPDYVDPGKSVPELLEGFGGGQPNRTSDALHCLAFGYMLDGDAAHLSHARALLRTIAGTSGELPTGGFETSVCYASFGGQVTIAYDILCDDLPDDERAALANHLRECVVRRYERDVLAPPDSHSWGRGTNVFLRNYEKYVLAVAVLPGFGDAGRGKLEHADRWLRQSIHLGIDEGGAIFEGPAYGQRDAEWLAFMAEVLYRAGISNLWDEEPRYAAFHRHWAHLVLPCGRGRLTYCDSHRTMGGRPPTGLLLGARRPDDPVVQWAYGRLGGRDVTGTGEPAPEGFSQNLGQSLLWDDDAAEETQPDAAGWPCSRNSGAAGVITMRTGWGDDASLVSLIGSVRTHGNHIHQQVDAGHFSLYALGEAFSVDPGYGDILGCYHSVMRPGAREPSRAPDGFGHMWHGARVKHFAAGTHADYGCVDGAEQWECHWAYRHLLFVRAPGADPYVIILDNVNRASQHEPCEWILNSEPGNAVSVDAAAERAVVQGERHRLELAWNYPAADEYDRPHTLALSAVECDGAPEQHGIGKRPQLRATLTGCNGLLLSVLLPRRSGDPPVEVERLWGREQFGLRVRIDDVEDTILASAHTGDLDCGGIDGEAVLAVCRRDAARRVTWWAACEAYALSVDGVPVMPRQGVAEVLAERGA